MDYSPIDKLNRDTLQATFNELEAKLNCDVIVFYGDILDGVELCMQNMVENLCLNEQKHKKLAVMLTTNGGSIIPVKRMVNIFRNFYSEVNFYIPDHAYSAGTVWCCSGDNIVMNYFSALGPIDPQVVNKEGKLVAALGYLDKINELIEKSRNNELTEAEFIILKDFDLGELRAYEQARDLAVDLLTEWLSKYKFKNWIKHGTSGNRVTEKEKKDRAKAIAEKLSDNNIWKSHSQPISREELEKLKLKISKMEDDVETYELIKRYHSLMIDFIQKYGLDSFLETRNDICRTRG